MGLEVEFHELFNSNAEPIGGHASVANAKKKGAGPNDVRVKGQRAAKGRLLRIDQLQMQQFNAMIRGVDKYQADRPMKGHNLALAASAVAKQVTGNAAEQSPVPAGPPFIELNCNPSSFSVFSAIRHSVLETKLRKATAVYNQAISGHSCEDNGDDSEEEKSKSSLILKVMYMVFG